MKKIYAILAMMVLAVSAFAQNGKSIYNKYSDNRGVSAIYISPGMFRMMGALPEVELEGMDDGEVDLSKIIRSLTGFYLLETENPAIKSKLAADVDSFIRKGDYELLMEMKDDGDVTRIYVIRKGDTIFSVVFLNADSEEIAFICVDGEMKADDLDRMIAAAAIDRD